MSARDQGHVAAQCFAELRGTICDEVETPAIVRIDTWGRRPNEPLLRNDLALWPDCFAHDPYPRALEWLGSPGEEAGAGAGSIVITVNIDRGAAAGSMGPTSAWCDGTTHVRLVESETCG